MTVDGARPSWGQRLFGSGPFARLAKAHGSIAGGDAFFAVSLAGSLFFSVSIGAARPRVLLYLALTMAPFAVMTPLIGPLIDRVRGGQRLVIFLTCAGRGGVCLVMADELRTLLFYPLAFSVLVLGKTYSVAKSTLVPRVVADAETLVSANSRLSRTATIAGALGSGAAGAILALTAAPWVLRVGGGLYLIAGAIALRLPRPTRATPGPGAAVRAGQRASGFRGALSAMSLLRGGEGFVLFLLAFALKQAGAPAWLFGALVAGAGLGGFAGTFLAPRLRRVVGEEMLLAGGVASMAAAAVLASLSPGRPTMLVMATVLGTASSVGRRAFDSLVQREAPDVERGRLFARFETRFQLAWVVGAFLAVALRPPLWAGFLLLAAVAGPSAVGYAFALRDRSRG